MGSNAFFTWVAVVYAALVLVLLAAYALSPALRGRHPGVAWLCAGAAIAYGSLVTVWHGMTAEAAAVGAIGGVLVLWRGVRIGRRARRDRR